MKATRAICATLTGLLAASLVWPACDYPSVTFAPLVPPVPTPVVGCNDGQTCKDGVICCVHTVAGQCDKCLSFADCEQLTTCDGDPAEFLPIGCDTDDDCAEGWGCCLVADAELNITSVACVEDALCKWPLCGSDADCDSAATCTALIPGEASYVGLLFCI